MKRLHMQQLSNGDNFASEGTFSNIGRHFGCHNLWVAVSATGISWVEDKDATKHPTRHWTAPQIL